MLLTTLRHHYENDLERELTRQRPRPVRSVAERELRLLPLPVQRFVRRAGGLGMTHASNARIVWRWMDLRSAPDSPSMHLRCEQTNFFGDPVRLALMTGKLGGIVPLAAYDSYREGRGELRVQVAGVLPVKRASGHNMDCAELVTCLSEGLFVPALLLEPNVRWAPVDARSAHATLWHGDNVVTGVFSFDDNGDRARFETYDRWRDGPKRPTRQRWSAEVSGFALQQGVRVPSRASATWHAPEGNFEYVRGSIESITTDITGPAAAPAHARLRSYLAARKAAPARVLPPARHEDMPSDSQHRSWTPR